MFEQLAHSSRQVLAAARQSQQAIDAMRNHGGIAADIRGHNGYTGGHGLQQDNAQALAARGRRAEDISAGEVARFVLISHVACEYHVPPATPLYKTLEAGPQASFAHKDEARIRMFFTNCWNSSQQIFCPFTFLKAAHEENILFAIPQFWEWLSVLASVIQLDTIRNDAIIRRKVVRDKCVSGAGDGDAAIQVAQHRSQQGHERSIGQVEGRSQTDLSRGMKCANGNRLRTAQRGQGQAGYQRFMDVQNIKFFPL